MDTDEKTALAVEIIYLLLRGQNKLALKYLALRAHPSATDNMDDLAAAVDALLGARTMPYEIYWGIVYSYRDLRDGRSPSGLWAEACTRVCDAFAGGGATGLRALVTELHVEGINPDHVTSVGAEIDAALSRIPR